MGILSSGLKIITIGSNQNAMEGQTTIGKFNEKSLGSMSNLKGQIADGSLGIMFDGGINKHNSLES